MGDRDTAAIRRRRHAQAADWLLRRQDADLSEDDHARFEAWRASPENAEAYAAAERLMGDARAAIAGDAALRSTPAPKGGARKPIVAGLLVLAVAGGAFLALDGPMRLRADRIAGKGETPVFTLADGSTVQLNASSAIAEDISARGRTIRLLRGQAYFQVTPDPDRPFTVEAGDASVTALGTAFDVRLGAAETDVAVTEHAVLVEFRSARPPLRVDEGEQVAYQPASGEVTRGQDAALAASWRSNRLVVDNRDLAFVVEELNRRFPGRVVIARPGLAARKVSGVIDLADRAQALAFIARALGVEVVRLGPLVALI
ncbi:iron dicitrate transporter FecR [Methylopila jiangsuensis]|uniref:Iron dicitrate transporter FecR n=1 Tax=Methylopila jiangsuensis TaxID=586230 RepID=A0A9W6JL46_9HYPH|nr:FecR domain-containing protein [Methylopila jiangsuensis]MDR6284908.1 transmembrane sensor [Methylopila jiangsuensis]GLK77704.1 iron dicitrate transporter FecR [Methylopila jiangsuensis]